MQKVKSKRQETRRCQGECSYAASNGSLKDEFGHQEEEVSEGRDMQEYKQALGSREDLPDAGIVQLY